MTASYRAFSVAMISRFHCCTIAARLHRRTSMQSAVHSTSSTSRTSTSSAARTSGRKTAMLVGSRHLLISISLHKCACLCIGYGSSVGLSPQGVHAATWWLPGQLVLKHTPQGDVHNIACGASTGANHLVCIELALKIVQKINAGQRFMAYILLPLFPEGATSCLAWITAAHS